MCSTYFLILFRKREHHVSLFESSFDQLPVLSTTLISSLPKNFPFYNKPQMIEILSPNRAVHLIKLFRSAEARDPFSAFATLLPCCLYSSTLLPIPSPEHSYICLSCSPFWMCPFRRAFHSVPLCLMHQTSEDWC